VKEKEETYNYHSKNTKIRLQNKLLKTKREPKLNPIKEILKKTIGKEKITTQIEQAFEHTSNLFIKEFLDLINLEEKFDCFSPLHFYFKKLKCLINYDQADKYNKKLPYILQHEIEEIFNEACNNTQSLKDLLQPILKPEISTIKEKKQKEFAPKPQPNKKKRRRRRRKKTKQQQDLNNQQKQKSQNEKPPIQIQQQIQPKLIEKAKEIPTIIEKNADADKKEKIKVVSTFEQESLSFFKQIPQTPVINRTEQATAGLDLPRAIASKK